MFWDSFSPVFSIFCSPQPEALDRGVRARPVLRLGATGLLARGLERGGGWRGPVGPGRERKNYFKSVPTQENPWKKLWGNVWKTGQEVEVVAERTDL